MYKMSGSKTNQMLSRNNSKSRKIKTQFDQRIFNDDLKTNDKMCPKEFVIRPHTVSKPHIGSSTKVYINPKVSNQQKEVSKMNEQKLVDQLTRAKQEATLVLEPVEEISWDTLTATQEEITRADTSPYRFEDYSDLKSLGINQ